MANVRVLEAIPPAWAHVRRVLFQPFDIGRWLTLGFLSFLQSLGEGGCNINIPDFSGPQRAQPTEREVFQEALRWVTEHLPLVLTVCGVLLVLGIGLVLLLVWLSARGTFAYLDCITTNRAEVRRPWREHRVIANSYFVFRVVVGLIALAVIVVLTVPVVVLIVSRLRAGEALRAGMRDVGCEIRDAGCGILSHLPICPTADLLICSTADLPTAQLPTCPSAQCLENRPLARVGKAEPIQILTPRTALLLSYLRTSPFSDDAGGQDRTLLIVVIVWAFLLILIVLASVVLNVLLVDFVAPVQYLTKVGAFEALKAVWGLVASHVGTFLLYFIVRVALSLAVGCGIFALGCLTCCVFFCIAAIPVLSQTVLQPVYAFFRTFPLFVLRQFGPEWDGIAPPAPPADTAT